MPFNEWGLTNRLLSKQQTRNDHAKSQGTTKFCLAIILETLKSTLFLFRNVEKVVIFFK